MLPSFVPLQISTLRQNRKNVQRISVLDHLYKWGIWIWTSQGNRPINKCCSLQSTSSWRIRARTWRRRKNCFPNTGSRWRSSRSRGAAHTERRPPSWGRRVLSPTAACSSCSTSGTQNTGWNQSDFYLVWCVLISVSPDLAVLPSDTSTTTVRYFYAPSFQKPFQDIQKIPKIDHSFLNHTWMNLSKEWCIRRSSTFQSPLRSADNMTSPISFGKQFLMSAWHLSWWFHWCTWNDRLHAAPLTMVGIWFVYQLLSHVQTETLKMCKPTSVPLANKSTSETDTFLKAVIMLCNDVENVENVQPLSNQSDIHAPTSNIQMVSYRFIEPEENLLHQTSSCRSVLPEHRSTTAQFLLGLWNWSFCHGHNKKVWKTVSRLVTSSRACWNLIVNLIIYTVI